MHSKRVLLYFAFYYMLGCTHSHFCFPFWVTTVHNKTFWLVEHNCHVSIVLLPRIAWMALHFVLGLMPLHLSAQSTQLILLSQRCTWCLPNHRMLPKNRLHSDPQWMRLVSQFSHLLPTLKQRGGVLWKQEVAVCTKVVLIVTFLLMPHLHKATNIAWMRSQQAFRSNYWHKACKGDAAHAQITGATY